MIDTKSLKEKYSPEGSTLRQYQYKMLDEVRFIDRICKENNITYFLCAGSALGAARHGGFIPWDDDMDIALYEKDFKKLIKILEDLDDDKYVLHSQRSDFNYIFPFPKFRERRGNVYGEQAKPPRCSYKYKGTGIDIYCIAKDSYKTNVVTTYLKELLVGRMYKIKNNRARKVFTKINWEIWMMLVPICRLIFNVGREEGEYRCAAGQGSATELYDPKEIIPTRKMVFEGIMLPVPNEYDAYLTHIYGNWRELPKEVTVHNEELINK